MNKILDEVRRLSISIDDRIHEMEKTKKNYGNTDYLLLISIETLFRKIIKGEYQLGLTEEDVIIRTVQKAVHVLNKHKLIAEGKYLNEPSDLDIMKTEIIFELNEHHDLPQGDEDSWDFFDLGYKQEFREQHHYTNFTECHDTVNNLHLVPIDLAIKILKFFKLLKKEKDNEAK